VIRKLEIQRFSVISAGSFEDVVARIESQIGRPDLNEFRKGVSSAQNNAELADVVHRMVGPANLMEFARFHLGEILKRELGSKAPKSLRLLAGNPLIMAQILRHLPDVGSYAPVTILIDERPDGVHLSYDRMASFLAPYGSPDAMQVARNLDAKLEALLNAAAG
jgi:uncharacterized protein (DUF302 family)